MSWNWIGLDVSHFRLCWDKHMFTLNVFKKLGLRKTSYSVEFCRKTNICEFIILPISSYENLDEKRQ